MSYTPVSFANQRPEITGRTRLCGLLGHSIAYTLSPAIHNFSAALLGKDVIYVPFDLTRDGNLKEFLSSMWALGVIGFSVTQPFKTEIVPHLASASANAVNTVYRTSTGFAGTSTDGLGLSNALARLDRPLEKYATIVIIGAGGAAVSILEFLHHIGYQGEVRVLARQPKPLPEFALKVNVGPLEVTSLDTAVAKGGRDLLLLQASSAPHQGDDLSKLVPATASLKGVFFDMCYGKTSALLPATKQRGVICSDGVSMLIEQARESQKLWWGQAAPFEDIRAALNKAGYGKDV